MTAVVITGIGCVTPIGTGVEGLWAGLEAGSMHAHMNHEGHAQLFVRMTTQNFEEAIRARREKRKPEYKD